MLSQINRVTRSHIPLIASPSSYYRRGRWLKFWITLYFTFFFYTLFNFPGVELEKGEILINNQRATKQLRRQIGYVVQEDIFLTHLTVKQSLQFAGELSIPDQKVRFTSTECILLQNQAFCLDRIRTSCASSKIRG